MHYDKTKIYLSFYQLKPGYATPIKILFCTSLIQYYTQGASDKKQLSGQIL